MTYVYPHTYTQRNTYGIKKDMISMTEEQERTILMDAIYEDYMALQAERDREMSQDTRYINEQQAYLANMVYEPKQ